MNRTTARGTLVLALGLMALVAFTGCDKAKEELANTDLGATADATKLIGTATSALAGITDLDSAKAALPKLQDLDGQLGQLVQKFTEMSPDQKSKLTSAVTSAMPQMESAITRITSIAGVGEVVGPVLESLQAKFKSLT